MHYKKTKQHSSMDIGFIHGTMIYEICHNQHITYSPNNMIYR